MSGEDRPSKKQRELLEFIADFIKQHGYGPSYREIMRALDYKSVSTVAVHVDGLIAKGHLLKRDHSARSLEVVGTLDTSSATSPKVAVVGALDAKWLVDAVQSHFDAYEKKPSAKARDNLFVLVGALHVLGLNEAARAFKSKLLPLAKED
jgi:SOS-response transcriptional repressor LexA